MWQSSDTEATGGRVIWTMSPGLTWQSSDSEPDDAEFSERGRFGRVQKAPTLRQNSDFQIHRGRVQTARLLGRVQTKIPAVFF